MVELYRRLMDSANICKSPTDACNIHFLIRADISIFSSSIIFLMKVCPLTFHMSLCFMESPESSSREYYSKTKTHC